MIPVIRNFGIGRAVFFLPPPLPPLFFGLVWFFWLFFSLKTCKSFTSRFFFSSVLFQCDLHEYGIREVGPGIHRRSLMLWLHSSRGENRFCFGGMSSGASTSPIW